MDLDAGSTLNDVTVGDDAVIRDKKSAAAAQGIFLRVEGLDRHRRRFYAFDKFRQEVLRTRISRDTREKNEKEDKNGAETSGHLAAWIISPYTPLPKFFAELCVLRI